jgi:hypothetical protein
LRRLYSRACLLRTVSWSLWIISARLSVKAQPAEQLVPSPRASRSRISGDVYASSKPRLPHASSEESASSVAQVLLPNACVAYDLLLDAVISHKIQHIFRVVQGRLEILVHFFQYLQIRFTPLAFCSYPRHLLLDILHRLLQSWDSVDLQLIEPPSYVNAEVGNFSRVHISARGHTKRPEQVVSQQRGEIALKYSCNFLGLFLGNFFHLRAVTC